jgi:hypothetical protein
VVDPTPKLPPETVPERSPHVQPKESVPVAEEVPAESTVVIATDVTKEGE